MNHRPLDASLIAQRIDRTMTEHGVGVRRLERLVKERLGQEARGTTYGSLHKYRKGTVRRPRVDVLRTIAEALSVRPEWLICGEGEPTLREERQSQQTDAARLAIEQEASRELLQRMEVVLAEELPRFHEGALDATWNRVWMLVNTWVSDSNFFLRHPALISEIASTSGRHPEPISFHPEVQEMAVREVAGVLRSPADAAGLSLDLLSHHHLDMYVAAAALAVQVLVTRPKRLTLRTERPQSSAALKP